MVQEVPEDDPDFYEAEPEDGKNAETNDENRNEEANIASSGKGKSVDLSRIVKMED
eukprot:CAMPEP_0114581320 /NCGR_PEP_ID=MMETSP0125-20121206/5443_1 /TAXON_ID=485358 ORGANISM="Aristerostoma sp., Strain ATCC 50986" /NCGR_SAMPLE_ID=MMETSP0125 /ASSEMBLY_ACC=CAM_ASM_000245 /LENGTH=55 /DNA_ID=CAMNT_0001773439 /DNA_START=1705 /DNA_END=1873 /DNA_ORIENTATION=-